MFISQWLKDTGKYEHAAGSLWITRLAASEPRSRPPAVATGLAMFRRIFPARTGSIGSNNSPNKGKQHEAHNKPSCRFAQRSIQHGQTPQPSAAVRASTLSGYPKAEPDYVNNQLRTCGRANNESWTHPERTPAELRATGRSAPRRKLRRRVNPRSRQ